MFIEIHSLGQINSTVNSEILFNDFMLNQESYLICIILLLILIKIFSPVISDLPYDLFKLTMHTMQTFVADAGKL